ASGRAGTRRVARRQAGRAGLRARTIPGCRRGLPDELAARHRPAAGDRRAGDWIGNVRADDANRRGIRVTRQPGVPDRVIVETIVTTRDAEGQINVAPMGVEWDPSENDARIVLKPFLQTATYRNLSATGTAVVNLVDDVRIFARAAI